MVAIEVSQENWDYWITYTESRFVFSIVGIRPSLDDWTILLVYSDTISTNMSNIAEKVYLLTIV